MMHLLQVNRISLALLLMTVGIAGSSSACRAADPMPAAEILQDLRSFQQMCSVLYIAAHPDDENTRLIAYLARGRAYRMGYLSLTRGDGGQNLIGPELREQLGVIRTQELLAARRIDGGRQFFARANDFGFSKDYKETFNIWDKQQVLSDVVRVIRQFRPDVLMTRFSTEPGGTHGHHTGSAILALEAFKLAGDPSAFPEQLDRLKVWQPKRILWNGGSGARGGVKLEIGGYDPLVGLSFGEIAALSRSMHKSQAMGGVGSRGASVDGFTLLAGEPAEKDILDGVDTTWGRVPGGAEIGQMTGDIIAKFNPLDPVASVPALLTLRSRVATLPDDPILSEKRRLLDRILQHCLGLYVETTISQGEVIPGQKLAMTHSAILRNNYKVRRVAVRHVNSQASFDAPMDLAVNKTVSFSSEAALAANTPLSQPYWLREEGTVGMYRVDDPSLIGRPENPPVFPIEQLFEIDGQTLAIEDQPVQVIGDPVKGEIRRNLKIIPPVSLRFQRDLELFAPGASKSTAVEVTAARSGASGTLHLDLPAGWQCTPASQTFELKNSGESASFNFNITAPQQVGTARILAVADVGGASYHYTRIEIAHDHIPTQLMLPPARLKAVSLDLAIRGHQIAYLPGAGDTVADSLERMGYVVTPIGGADLTPDRLRAFDAVVVGIRAFNTRTDLAPHLTTLFAYVENGGNVIVQYNTPNGLLTTRLAPYSLELSRDRVTDENAPVKILAPEHPAMTTPNKIVASDFDGWVQERGLNFPGKWDAHFTPLLECADPGESPLDGSLLVAQHGKGYFIYTGISWFRQLPEGVPGAYRLFANLVSLGK